MPKINKPKKVQTGHDARCQNMSEVAYNNLVQRAEKKGRKLGKQIEWDYTYNLTDENNK